ncbi:MAG TPA: serine hydrolase domain-containing protein [Vicinamibacterales bacterium]|nr:serine hydrolase domain-containing protein [Vicinamibacterales bacterium]
MAYVRRMCAVIAGTALMGLPLVAGSIPSGKPEDVGLSTERVKRIGETVQRHIDARDVAGAVTLVARKGRIAHFEARGMMDIDAKKPMPKDGLFRLASMSKPITGVAVMMLVEEGKIRLSDPVSRFIPEFANLKTVAVPRPGTPAPAKPGAEVPFDTVPAARQITIADLLKHGSGLVSGGLGAGAASRLAPRAPTDTLATYIPRLAAVPLDFQPGTLWRYSGQAGFDVLSRVVEVVSGQTFDKFLRQRLLDPLGMKDTGFFPGEGRAPRLVTIYQSTPEGLRPGNQTVSTVYFSGAGGMMSTAEDYLQFAQMMLNGGELNGTRYLSPRTVELMTSNHTGDMVNGQFGRPAQGMGFGLSMQVVQDPVAANLRVSKGAYGWAGGTGVSFWVEPAEQIVSIYFIQGGSGGGLRQDFENAVYQSIVAP